jgi:O-antigen/teichoic acid export membrane protein
VSNELGARNGAAMPPHTVNRPGPHAPPGPDRPASAKAANGWRAPQHRDGMALVLSSAVSSGVGLLFWVLAARLFDPATVGLNSTAISTMTLLGSAAHLNLGNALLRFVPVAGRGARALIAWCFAVGIGAGAVLGLGFALGAGIWATELVEAFGYPALIAFFVISTPIWTVFVLQDAALTSVKRANLVLVKNLVFSLLKVGLLVLVAVQGMGTGIAVSWVIATLLAIVAWPRILSKSGASTAPPSQPVTVRDVAGFVRADYAGNVFWQAAVFGLPLVVLARLDADDAAVYGMVWQIAFALYLVVIGMGKSLVAHTATDPAALDSARRAMERKALTLVVPGALVAAAAAYPVLSLFGSSYAGTGTLLLVLLVLSAIPNVVTSSTTWAARVSRRGAVLFGLPAVLCVAVVAGSWVLMPVLGVTGTGWAWLGAQCAVAAVILVGRRMSRPARR